MFEIKMTRDEIIDGLRSTYGKEFTAADVRGFCAANDIANKTVTKKVKELIFLINSIELQIKKNFNNSILIITDFILKQSS